MVIPLTTGSLTAARSPSSSARPIWCLVRGRITPPRGAEDTLLTLSTRRPLWTNNLHLLIAARARNPAISSLADEEHVGSLLYILLAPRAEAGAQHGGARSSAHHWVGSGLCGFASGATEYRGSAKFMMSRYAGAAVIDPVSPALGLLITTYVRICGSSTGAKPTNDVT